MSLDEMRLEALRLANGNESPDYVVERAAEYLAFLLGKSNQTPREQINAALDAANVN